MEIGVYSKSTCITFPCDKQIPMLVLGKLEEPALQEHKIVPGLRK